MNNDIDPVVVAYFCGGVFDAYSEIGYKNAPSPMTEALDVYQDDVEGQVALIQEAIADCGLILAAFDEHLREVVAGQVHPAYQVYEPLGKIWLRVKCGADIKGELRSHREELRYFVSAGNFESFESAFDAFSAELAKIIQPHKPYRRS